MLEPVLDEQSRKLLAEERGLLAQLGVLLGRLGASAEDQESFAGSVRQLEELFLLVTVGEFNAGKSAFINALLGQQVLEEGVTPTTTRIGLIRYGDAIERTSERVGLDVVTAPVSFLREINIVDTPGTNAVLREHEALTREFVPRSDLVLFVTSADRPFTESERVFLETIRAWGKKIVVAVNKVDILEGPEDVQRVVEFVAEKARTLLDVTPEIFPVSARQALRAKTPAVDDELLRQSGFPALEAYIDATLDEKERLKLKLLNPLGVGTRVLEKALEVVDGGLGLLSQDVMAIEEIDGQLALYREDLTRDFRFRIADVENVLYDFEKRGHQFFDETLRLGRVFDLMNRAKVQAEFEKRVVADLPGVVEHRVAEIVEWMIASDMRQWRAVMERLQGRSAEHGERVVGRFDGAFEQDRARLLDTVKREAQRAVESYDQEAEARRLAESVRDAVAGTAILQAGALGLGAAVTALASTTLADVTGILAAGALSVVGLLVIPARRRAARSQLRAKVAELRTRLMATLNQQFERELERSIHRIEEAIAPYTRFVRSERDRLESSRRELGEIRDGFERIKGQLDGS
jgi:small GTP-binding protein